MRSLFIHPAYVSLLPGQGRNVNVALNGGDKGDGDYLYVWSHVLMPLAYEFAPDLVIISAGFDAALGDPLGGYRVTPPGYAHLTHQLKALAQGRLVVALEGGYNLGAISESMAAVVEVLLGDMVSVIWFHLLCARVQFRMCKVCVQFVCLFLRRV